MKKIVLSLINWYQRSGGEKTFFVECNFTPSCSEYMKQSIQCYGLMNGLKLGFSRLKRCNQRDLVGKIDDPVPSVVPNNAK